MSAVHPRVKVINTQPRTVEGYASTFDYWKQVTNSTRKSCAAMKCSKDVIDCAVVHVKEEGYGNGWYYVPLCPECTKSGNDIFIESSTSLVSARKDLVNKDKSTKVVKGFK